MKKVDNRLQFAALALAEELNFDSTAERLHISEFELRELIGQLQGTLSLVLFVPNSNPVELTDQGKRYIDQLRKSSLRRRRDL